MVKRPQDSIEEVLKRKQFRVSVFGSARMKPSDPEYREAYSLGKEIGKMGFDIVTGGGPGIMEAANSGHIAGRGTKETSSIGLTINLPFEVDPNKYLDVHSHFETFSRRLDSFMRLSQVLIVTPGGIGTLLEFFYSWQLTQVQHLCATPIILFGEMWGPLMKWVKAYPLKSGYIGEKDVALITTAKSRDEVMNKILEFHALYEKEGESFCFNYLKYKTN